LPMKQAAEVAISQATPHDLPKYSPLPQPYLTSSQD